MSSCVIISLISQRQDLAFRLARHDCHGNDGKLFELCIDKTDGLLDTTFTEGSNLPYNLFLGTLKKMA